MSAAAVLGSEQVSCAAVGGTPCSHASNVLMLPTCWQAIAFACGGSSVSTYAVHFSECSNTHVLQSQLVSTLRQAGGCVGGAYLGHLFGGRQKLIPGALLLGVISASGRLGYEQVPLFGGARRLSLDSRLIAGGEKN